MNNVGKLRKILGLACLSAGIFIPEIVKAEGSPIYYDSFYEEYYKAFPDAKPKKKKQTIKRAQPQQTLPQPVYYNGYDPYMQMQTNAMYTQNISPVASAYQSQGVEHNTKNWYVDIRMKKGYGNFMFDTTADSILTWDEVDTKETVFKVSRDFMIKNRQYVFTATYGTGSGTTTRTSDDDIFNSLHLITLGDGTVDLKNWSVGFGMRNAWKLGNWDVTPYIGYKKKEQNFEMANHVTPAPFYLEKFCNDVGDITVNGVTYYNVCTGGINITSQGLDASSLYYADANGNEITNMGTVTNTTIPGYVTLDDGSVYVNLAYGDAIPDEDYCFHQEGQNPEVFTCLKSGTAGANLVSVFGGVSSLEEQAGTTHMYYVDWAGPYIGINLERKISSREDLSIYGEYFKPHYKVWANWPNRTDLAHDPSFIDEGGSAYGLLFTLDYRYSIRSNIQLVMGMEYEYIETKGADSTLFESDGYSSTESGFVKVARWKSYGFNVGLAFKL